MAHFSDLAVELDEFAGDLLSSYGMAAYASMDDGIQNTLNLDDENHQALIDMLHSSATMALLSGNWSLAKRGYELADKLHYADVHERLQGEFAPWDRPSPLDGGTGTLIVGCSVLESLEAARTEGR